MADKAEIKATAERLKKKLEAVRSHQRSVWFREGMGLLLAVVLPALAMAMILDNIMHLHMAIRLPLLVGLVALTVVLVRRFVAMMSQSLTPEQLAVKVERKFPEVDNRLINSLLLAGEDDPASYEVIHEIVSEGVTDASQHNLNSAVPKKRMRILTAAAALAIAAMVGYGAAYPEYFGNALARVLVPFAGTDALTRTRIVEVTPKDAAVLSGDDMTISVKLDGRLPETADVVFTPEDEEMQVGIMRPRDEANSNFACLKADVSKSFTYHIAAGDARSDEYAVTVHHRPVVAKMNINIKPPAYSAMPAMTQTSSSIKALPGSRVDIRATCSKDISKAVLSITTADKPINMNIQGGRTALGSFVVNSDSSYRIDLTDTAGFSNKPIDRNIEVLIDEPPAIDLSSPPAKLVVKPDGSVPFKFLVTDEYGIRKVDIVQIDKDDKGKRTEKSLQFWTAEDKTKKEWPFKYLLPISDVDVQPGKSAILQVVAKDWNDVTGPGVAHSRQITVTVMSPEDAKDKDRQNLKKAAVELAMIIQKQKLNLGRGRELRSDELRKPGTIAQSADKLKGTISLQEEIHSDSGELLGRMDDTLPMKSVLRLLYEQQMVLAVRQLKAVAEADKPAVALHKALDTEQTILERLTGRSEQLRQIADTAGMRDIFAALEELQRKQKKIRKNTETVLEAGGAARSKPLANKQDDLAGDVVVFKDLLTQHAHAVSQSDAEAAKHYEEAVTMVDQLKIRQDMLLSAAKLDKGELSPAVKVHDKILANLKALEDFLREPVVAEAAKKLKKMQKAIEDANKKAKKLAKLEAAVKEISEEMERSKDLTGDDAEKARQQAQEAEELLDKMADVVEKMAKDLAVFPEIPVCNELVEKAHEVFEDIEQAKGSEDADPTEIAVDRDDGLLKALDGTKEMQERMDDMEMWLEDKPDSIKWKQENFDVDEIENIPLADLPDELEDLVGELLDKAEEMDQEAQDAASNQMVPDLPAGWGVADGPMPSFGAKGKSGNTKPNANEMTGRSGAGREGQANGEVVGKVAKDLEGREPEARRTRDPFAKGQIEEENPNSQAKATGGGKQSGIGGEGGLRGSAPPRNQLHLRELQRRQRKMRRDTESVYSKAALLYLPTGELDEAILLMEQAEKQAKAGNYAGFAETQKRIVHALRNSRRAAQGKAAVKIDPRLKLPTKIKEEMFDARDEPIPPEFEKLVAEYYKAIAAGAVK